MRNQKGKNQVLLTKSLEISQLTVERRLKKCTGKGRYMVGVEVIKKEKVMYKKHIKRILDFFLALTSLIILAFPMLVISLIIFVDDPGPVIFRQKRIGIRRTFFYCYKFRSMKMSTPHDVPTHLLKNPEKYITKTGKFLRKMSLDELPQIFNILKGDMAFVGPRPALWNQEDLVEERDHQGANDVRPGLTGWAQINGRDKLEISEKAKLDGEYVRKLDEGGLQGFGMDVQCFFGTFFSVLHHDGVVEGGTGSLGLEDRNEKKDIDYWSK